MLWKICSWFLVRTLNCSEKRKEIVSDNEGNKILHFLPLDILKGGTIVFSPEKLKGNQRKQRVESTSVQYLLFLSWEKKSMMIFICGNCSFAQWEAGSFFWSVTHKAVQTCLLFPSIARNVVRKYRVVVSHKLGPSKINSLIFKIFVQGGLASNLWVILPDFKSEPKADIRRKIKGADWE